MFGELTCFIISWFLLDGWRMDKLTNLANVLFFCRYMKSQSLPHLLPSPSYSDILDISTKHFAQQITAMDNVNRSKGEEKVTLNFSGAVQESDPPPVPWLRLVKQVEGERCCHCGGHHRAGGQIVLNIVRLQFLTFSSSSV